MDENVILHSGDFSSFIDGFPSYTRQKKAFTRGKLVGSDEIIPIWPLV